MRKSDKKIDNQLRIILTRVCETALEDIEGFKWLTHLVNYSNFPQSLKVVCVFDKNEDLENYLQSDFNNKLLSLVQSELKSLNIKLKNITEHIEYDTEENCNNQHSGNWASRLN